MTKLQIVEDRLREVYASPEKPKKKKNYALQKVEEPPSDNEWLLMATQMRSN